MTILDPEQTFASLSDTVGLDVRLKKALARLGHSRPTLVQSKCLPLAISSGRDLLIRAKTGSGKTLAYLLPALHKTLSKKGSSGGVEVVIMVPTRELCHQVQKTIESLSYYCDDAITVAVLSIGKVRGSKSRQDLERQEASLRDQPNIVVATPNGLLTHIRSGALDIKTTVHTVVVDEADLVLSFGYSNDIAEIMKALPRIYQGFLMSATLSPEVESLKKVVLHSPVVLKLEQDDPRDTKSGDLKQFYVSLPKEDKKLVIYVFLKLGLLKGKGIFFVNSTDGGYRLKLFLEQFHIRSSVLNAELPYRSRMNIIEQFNVGNFDYLIATDESADVRSEQKKPNNNDESESDDEQNSKKGKKKDSEYGVSRGLDFRNVSFVVNVDFPPSTKSYAHRVGRTARGGAKGVALSLVDSKSSDEWQTLLAVQDDQPTLSAGEVTPYQGSNLGDAEMTPAPKDIPQPSPLDFDLAEIEGFRYRVEDVGRAVTKNAVREARANELKMEMLNSERLESHFDENPADLQLLRHDRLATNISKVHDHLKHVPKYLLPKGMQVANLNKKRKKKKVKQGTGGARRKDNDPLQSFGGDNNRNAEDEMEHDPLVAEFMDDDTDDEQGPSKKQKVQSEVFANTRDGTGQSTAGRNAWKQKHKKGQFSGKKRKSERKKKDPLGI